MASSVLQPPTLLPFPHGGTHLKVLSYPIGPSMVHNKLVQHFKSKPSLTFRPSFHLGRLLTTPSSVSTVTRASSHGSLDGIEENETLPSFEERPVKFTFWVLFWASLSLVWFAASGDANAAADSIRASSFGLKIATALRSSGWRDEAVVFALATLPVIELRGAIPVGYWLQLKPALLTVLSVLGNMVPVPFIILYLKRFATFLAGRNRSASRFLEMLFERAKEKAGPVEEFQWLGLMLFVAVPFPGTGAWTGAIIASILDMPFWSAVSANFFGVMLAGLLVNLLVNLGLKYAIVTGIILFIISTFMWSILRNLKKSFSSSN
uniref:Small multi-drug export protein n=1 Tax=Davidia involucrata TaxID=16924 RepID=A0A5B7B3Z1_DAVIN